MKKSKLKSFSLLLWNYILILKILPVNRFKDSKAAILTLKILTGSRWWFCKIIGSEKLVKDLKNHQRLHRKYCLKCLSLQKISISWHCPFIKAISFGHFLWFLVNYNYSLPVNSIMSDELIAVDVFDCPITYSNSSYTHTVWYK